jgi:hypothetical protein
MVMIESPVSAIVMLVLAVAPGAAARGAGVWDGAVAETRLNQPNPLTNATIVHAATDRGIRPMTHLFIMLGFLITTRTGLTSHCIISGNHEQEDVWPSRHGPELVLLRSFLSRR